MNALLETSLGSDYCKSFSPAQPNCPQLLSCKGVFKGVSKGKAGFQRPSSLCLKYKMFPRMILAPVYRFYLRNGSFWLSVRSRKLARLLKLLVIVLSCTLFFYLPSLLFTSESGENFSDQEQKSTDTYEKGEKGRLTIFIWSDLCGGDVKVLRDSPFYPSYPSQQIIHDISEFQIEDSKTEYGQTIAGFLNPARSGSYRFAIASDDSSELWLSPSENPDEKQLIASVFVEDATGWTKKNELNKYPNQISRDIQLRNGGRYYIEVVHKQGEGDGFVQVFWSNPGVTEFQLISSEYLSSCSVSSKQDAISQLFAKRLVMLQSAWEEYSRFFTLPLISEVGYLPQCKYKSSFIPKDKLDKDNGRSLVSLSNVFPQDDTFMGSKGNVWSWSNRAADREIVQSVVEKMIASLCEKTDK